MEGNSIDGRRWKKPAAPTSASTRYNEVCKELKPASPPRVNPWARGASTTTVSDGSPALPSMDFPVLEPANSATRYSRASSTSTCPQSGDADASQPPPTTRSVSTCSDSSRQIFEAAAPRATESLWVRPFGADVVVHSTTMTFRIHRNIVEPQSGWFRDNLPPPNPDGSPVILHMNYPGEGVAHCFRFMYTGKTEICDFKEVQPWNVVHLPRCVLAYSAAVFLRMSKMAARILRIVEKTATNLEILVTSTYIHRDLEYAECVEFSWNYQNALWILHHQGPLPLMMPMRLAMASVLDGSLFWLMRQPTFLELLRTTWRHGIDVLLFDQAEYRRLLRDLNPSTKSPVASEAALKKLFENEVEDVQKNKADMETASGITESNEDVFESRGRSDSMNYRRSSV